MMNGTLKEFNPTELMNKVYERQTSIHTVREHGDDIYFIAISGHDIGGMVLDGTETWDISMVVEDKYGHQERIGKYEDMSDLTREQAITKMEEMVNEIINTQKEEEKKMMNKFEYDGKIYTQETSGYCYAQPIGGIKKRISKQAYTEAYNQFVTGQIADEEWQKQADLEKEQQELAKQARDEADEKAVLEAQKKAKGQKTGGQPSKAKKARKSKDVAFSYSPNGTDTITLTAKQVDFIKHIPDTCFWEHGLESTVWIDVLCDEIEGQFAGKPMTVGAMVSTLCEKGLGYRAVDSLTDMANGRSRKATYFALTELGQEIAKELGL